MAASCGSCQLVREGCCADKGSGSLRARRAARGAARGRPRGRGREPPADGGAKPRPFGLKKSEQDTLLVPGAAPPAHKKRTAQPHPLVSCLVVGPKGELSFALPAAAATTAAAAMSTATKTTAAATLEKAIAAP